MKILSLSLCCRSYICEPNFLIILVSGKTVGPTLYMLWIMWAPLPSNIYHLLLISQPNFNHFLYQINFLNLIRYSILMGLLYNYYIIRDSSSFARRATRGASSNFLVRYAPELPFKYVSELPFKSFPTFKCFKSHQMLLIKSTHMIIIPTLSHGHCFKSHQMLSPLYLTRSLL